MNDYIVNGDKKNYDQTSLEYDECIVFYNLVNVLPFEIFVSL